MSDLPQGVQEFFVEIDNANLSLSPRKGKQKEHNIQKVLATVRKFFNKKKISQKWVLILVATALGIPMGITTVKQKSFPHIIIKKGIIPHIMGALIQTSTYAAQITGGTALGIFKILVGSIQFHPKQQS